MIAPADLDADGLDEAILLANAEYQGQRFGLLYLLDWTGASPRIRRLGLPVPIHEGFLVSTPLLLEDIDLDGRVDILLLGRSRALDGDSIWVFLNSTDTTGAPIEFAAPCLLPATGATSLAAADIDGDDVVDLLLGLPRRSGVAVLSSPLGECLSSEHCFLRQPSAVDDPRGVDASVVLDRDDGPHLVVSGGGFVRLYTRTAAGLEESASFEAPGTAAGIDAADVDGDGRLEIALANAANGSVDLFDSIVNGWQRTGHIPLPGAPAGLLLRDIDGDSRPDPVVTLPDSNQVAVYLQGADGSFGDSKLLDVGPRPVQVVAGDVTGDTSLDLVVRLDGLPELSLLVGLGNGDYSDARSVRTIGAPGDIHLADLDGDGRAEILTTGRATDSLTVLRSAGESFVPAFFQLPIGTAADAVGTADTDGDGRPEVIIGGGGAKTLTIVQVDDSGGLSVRASLPFGLHAVADHPVLLGVADFDRNGWPDFVLTDTESGELTYLEASGCGREALFRRGDVTQDGVLNVSDAVVTLEYLFAGGRTIACPDAADVDDDGHVTLSDATRLLTYLFGSGEPPVSPGPDQCGSDRLPDELRACPGPCR